MLMRTRIFKSPGAGKSRVANIIERSRWMNIHPFLCSRIFSTLFLPSWIFDFDSGLHDDYRIRRFDSESSGRVLVPSRCRTARKPHRHARLEVLITRRGTILRAIDLRQIRSARVVIPLRDNPNHTCHAPMKQHATSCSRFFKEVANCFWIFMKRLKNLSNGDLNAMRIKGK